MPLKKLIVIGFIFSSAFGFSQKKTTLLTLNYKKSLEADFFSSELLLGGSEGYDFLLLNLGVNLSGFIRSEDPLPYKIPELEYKYTFQEFSSSRFGTHLGIGYSHLFTGSDHKRKLLPYFTGMIQWLRLKDNYDFLFTEFQTNEELNLPNEYHFHTIGVALQTGLMLKLDRFFSKLNLSFDFFIPINDGTYIPTSGTSSGSGFELPLVAFEPAIEICFGYKISGK